METKTAIRSIPLGQTVITPGALTNLHPADVHQALQRHARDDWGEVIPEDQAENELSLKEGFRLLSVYNYRNATKFWIITEADRSLTNVELHISRVELNRFAVALRRFVARAGVGPVTCAMSPLRARVLAYDYITPKTHRRDPALWLLTSHPRLVCALGRGLSLLNHLPRQRFVLQNLDHSLRHFIRLFRRYEKPCLSLIDQLNDTTDTRGHNRDS